MSTAVEIECVSCSRRVPARQAVTTLQGQLCMSCHRERVQAKADAWVPIDDPVDVRCPSCRSLPGEQCEDIRPDERINKYGAHRARMDVWAPPPTAEQIESVIGRFEEGATFGDVVREAS